MKLGCGSHLAIGKSGASAGPSGAERRLDTLDRDRAVPRMRKERASCSFDQGATAEPVSQLSAAGLWAPRTTGPTPVLPILGTPIRDPGAPFRRKSAAEILDFW